MDGWTDVCRWKDQGGRWPGLVHVAVGLQRVIILISLSTAEQ